MLTVLRLRFFVLSRIRKREDAVVHLLPRVRRSVDVCLFTKDAVMAYTETTLSLPILF